MFQWMSGTFEEEEEEEESLFKADAVNEEDPERDPPSATALPRHRRGPPYDPKGDSPLRSEGRLTPIFAEEEEEGQRGGWQRGEVTFHRFIAFLLWIIAAVCVC